ncbi:MAG: holo-ACP synthase [Burkholderiaceae bacterium]
MTQQPSLPADLHAAAHSPRPALCIGVDVVQVSAIEASLTDFGERFSRRFFTEHELSYAVQAPALAAQRLAARFAAKEAAIKAFGLSEAGISWRDIEVRKQPSGACTLILHHKAAALARPERFAEIALSLSHDGDYATAMVAALARSDEFSSTTPNPS